MKLGYFLSAALLFAFNAHEALALGSPKPKPTQPTPPPAQGENQLDPLVQIGLNMGIAYAKQNQRIANILNTLNINVADDIVRFINGNQDGSNLRNIIARLAYLQMSQNNQYSDILRRLNINSEQDLRNFLATQKGTFDYELILKLALDQALSNSKYAVWVQYLNIQTVEDFKELLKGNKDGNLLEHTLRIALFIAKAHPQYGQYVVYIEIAMAAFGVTPGSGNAGGDLDDDDIINLGPFNGMTVGEARAVQSLQ